MLFQPKIPSELQRGEESKYQDGKYSTGNVERCGNEMFLFTQILVHTQIFCPWSACSVQIAIQSTDCFWKFKCGE